MSGEPLVCTCCQGKHREVIAKPNPEAGKLEIQHRRHGTVHEGVYSLASLVKALDPKGTSFTPSTVGSA